MKPVLTLLLLLPLSGCAMFDAVESLPKQLAQTNRQMGRAGDQIVLSNGLLKTSNEAMAGLPAMMARTNTGVKQTNALMAGTHTLMSDTNALMRRSNKGVEETNELMRGTHTLMTRTHELIQASNVQLRATYWLIVASCLGSTLLVVILGVRFRRMPSQLEEYLALARAEQDRQATIYRASRRYRSASGMGPISN